jgi:hypothetical protein
MFPYWDSKACDPLIKNLGKKELGNIFIPQNPSAPIPPPPQAQGHQIDFLIKSKSNVTAAKKSASKHIKLHCEARETTKHKHNRGG